MRQLADLLKAKTIVMYGVGNQYKYCFNFINGITSIPIITVDSDSSKWGSLTFFGETIHSPESVLTQLQNFNVIITAIAYQYEVAVDLHERYGISPDHLYMYTSPWYENKIYDADKIKRHMKDIEMVAENLADESSKIFYMNAIHARIDRQPLYLEPNPNALYGEYKERLTLSHGDKIIDCGAYIGDTAEYYIKKLNGDCEIRAIEPFEVNYNQMNRRIKDNHWDKFVKTYNCAVGRCDKQSELIFNDDDFGMAINLSNSIGEKHQPLNVRALDTLFYDENIDYIKMDIEGEENEALLGGKELIRRCLPKMMISAYHKIEDFWTIPATIWNILPEYQIYVAHAPNVSTEMEYYCVVDK